MKPLRVPALTDAERTDLETLYRTTKRPRLRTRAQMVLLAADKGLKVPEIAPIILESESTVFRWLKRYLIEGVEGLKDAPREGRPTDVTPEQTGIRIAHETVRVHLKKAEIVLSRPQHKIASPDPEYLVKKGRSTKRETA